MMAEEKVDLSCAIECDKSFARNFAHVNKTHSCIVHPADMYDQSYSESHARNTC